MGSCDLARGRETRKLHTVCVVIVLVTGWLLVLPAGANNLREDDPLVLRPPSGQGLHFGFSLAHYTTNNEKWLLVGAPRANASVPSEIVHSGGLYKCQLSKSNVDGDCQWVDVDFSSQESSLVWAKTNYSEQGLGFSLASDGMAVVVCAPQWYATKSKFNVKSYLPAGMCFAAKSPDSEFTGFSPPFADQSALTMSYLNTGSCQFGMSAAYIKGQDTFAFGAPGCWSWQGDTWEIGQDFQTNSSRFLGQKDGIDGRYLGYSVASLKYGDKNAIVSSIPRVSESQGLEPTILILIQNPDDQEGLKVHYKITPSKVDSETRFAFFGYSLATLDLNGDGLEDLVVGAPFCCNNSTSYDQGAIIVYMQTLEDLVDGTKSYQMKEEDNAPQRMGSAAFSRFGSCMAAIGDLDGDGYEDLAVGAPFMAINSDEGDGTGAVYIYMGSQMGLEKEPRQVIKAAAGQFGFGSSIAQQLPSIEGEGYDVAVGVYNSDTVLVFKSKEVVNVTWDITFTEKIDLTENQCISASLGSLCPCVEAKFCLKYQKKIVKNDNANLGFSVTITSESAEEIFFVNEKAELKRNITVPKDENYCESFNIMAKPGIEEIKSFKFIGEVNLDPAEKNVVFDRHSVLKKEKELDIVIHCKSGDVSDCQSDIILEYDILDEYVLMSSQPMRINFTVKNQGETAYASKLNIQSADVFNLQDSKGSEVTCEEITNGFECNLERLDENFEISFIVNLIPADAELLSTQEHRAAVFNITAEVKTLSALKNPDTARKEVKVPIVVEGTLQLIKQTSQPGIVYFNSSSYYKSPNEANSEKELGPEIKHPYRILNANGFSIYGAELRVHWPLIIDGKYFLYLLENISFSEVGYSCQYPSGIVDPFNLKDTSITIRTQESQDNKAGASVLSMGIGDKSPVFKTITCSLGEISANKEVTVSLRSRLVLKTLVELEVGTAIESVSSFVELQITKMPLDYTPPGPSEASISTAISYQRESPDATVPVWLYIVSALGGLLLLGIIVIIMWKCGFFKRQRVKNADNANENKDEGENLTKEEEEEVENDDVKTPTSPMLKETENATGDFEFHRA